METNCKKCNNCAWFCHADHRCYGICNGGKAPEWSVCGHWTFDGLEDWEREDCEQTALVAMEV